jgi:Uma2 family endonuclease
VEIAMAVAADQPMPAEVFLDWIGRQSERHELVGGTPVRLMAGAKQSHNVVTSNILVALAPAAKRNGCRTTASDTAVRTGEFSVRYPDVVVDCGPPDPGAREASQPRLLVEVSSPNTLAVDLTDKLEEYQARSSVLVILLVEPDLVSAKAYRRQNEGGWLVERYDDLHDVIPLPEVGATLTLRDIYDTLQPLARPRLAVVTNEQP